MRPINLTVTKKCGIFPGNGRHWRTPAPAGRRGMKTFFENDNELKMDKPIVRIKKKINTTNPTIGMLSGCVRMLRNWSRADF